VRIETDDGLIGWGESFFAPGLTTIIEQMGALVTGDDARNIDAVIARLRLAASGLARWVALSTTRSQVLTQPSGI